MNTSSQANLKIIPAKASLMDIWSDEMMAVWVPIAVYWGQCTIFEVLMRLEIPFFEKYRIHTPEDRDRRNKVSFGKVLIMVALQHVVQIVLGIALMKNIDPAATQLKQEATLQKYTTVILSIFSALGQSNQQTVALATQLASVIQNYAVPSIQFFIAM
jgi:sphinganine C4-monooxygenase